MFPIPYLLIHGLHKNDLLTRSTGVLDDVIGDLLEGVEVSHVEDEHLVRVARHLADFHEIRYSDGCKKSSPISGQQILSVRVWVVHLKAIVATPSPLPPLLPKSRSDSVMGGRGEMLNAEGPAIG